MIAITVRPMITSNELHLTFILLSYRNARTPKHSGPDFQIIQECRFEPDR